MYGDKNKHEPDAFDTLKIRYFIAEIHHTKPIVNLINSGRHYLREFVTPVSGVTAIQVEKPVRHNTV